MKYHPVRLCHWVRAVLQFVTILPVKAEKQKEMFEKTDKSSQSTKLCDSFLWMIKFALRQQQQFYPPYSVMFDCVSISH